MSLAGVVIVKFTLAIARDLKRIEVGAGRGATFGTGVAVPFVSVLLAVRSKVPASLSRGGRDCRVVATSSISQGICSLHQVCARLVVASSYRFMHGRWQANKKHCQEEICVWGNARRAGAV